MFYLKPDECDLSYYDEIESIYELYMESKSEIIKPNNILSIIKTKTSFNYKYFFSSKMNNTIQNSLEIEKHYKNKLNEHYKNKYHDYYDYTKNKHFQTTRV
jgi:hypothetical protein